MFRVRVFTPSVVNEDGLPHAGAELVLGAERLRFLLDLSHWSIAAYERQWREGIARVLHGAPSSALMIAYRGPGDEVHRMWGLWRDAGQLYVQEHSVVAAELDDPFDPAQPYAHVGQRIAAAEHGLPIAEWRVDLVHLYAAALGIRWPLYPS